MKNKILKTILGVPLTMIGLIISGFIICMFTFFGWLFDDDKIIELDCDDLIIGYEHQSSDFEEHNTYWGL